MGGEESHCDDISNLDQPEVIMPDKSSRTVSKRNNSTRTAQVGTRDHHVDMDISDNDTSSDENEKTIKGRRSYVFTLAVSSLAWALALLPYWAHSSQFKDGKLPDSAGFKFLQTMQVIVLLCLWVGTFIPHRVCRGMPNLVVWTCAAGALCIIVISWALVFQHKTVFIKCIKAPCQMVIKFTKALCQMVINCTKVMYDKVQQWLPDLSLPDCIKAKLKKMPEEPL